MTGLVGKLIRVKCTDDGEGNAKEVTGTLVPQDNENGYYRLSVFDDITTDDGEKLEKGESYKTNINHLTYLERNGTIEIP